MLDVAVLGLMETKLNMEETFEKLPGHGKQVMFKQSINLPEEVETRLYYHKKLANGWGLFYVPHWDPEWRKEGFQICYLVVMMKLASNINIKNKCAKIYVGGPGNNNNSSTKKSVA